MKKILIITTSIFFLMVLSFFIWLNLPFEIQRRAEIKKGNAIIKNLRNYTQTKERLPASDDWESLERLGFTMTWLATKPLYEKLSDTSFQLIYVEGFDGPYLTYKSSTGKWSVE